MTLPMKVKKLSEAAQLPEYQTPGAAGLDLHAIEAGAIYPGQIIRVRTGIALEIPAGCVGLVRPRSGVAREGLLAVAGTIDSDYRGELKVILYNFGHRMHHIGIGDRIAQLVVVPYSAVEVIEAQTLSSTERGDRGFGSTGR